MHARGLANTDWLTEYSGILYVANQYTFTLHVHLSVTQTESAQQMQQYRTDSAGYINPYSSNSQILKLL